MHRRLTKGIRFFGAATLLAVVAPAAAPPVSFNAPKGFQVGSSPKSVAVGDFNGDGIPDMAAAVYATESGTVSILLGKGDGTFQRPVNYTVGYGAAAVAIGDFNHDGKLDLAVGVANYYYGSSNVSILLGNGDGTFQPAVTYSVQYDPVSVAVGDFNHDGKLDLVAANSGSNTVSILLGNGDGTFQPQVAYAVGNDPVSVAVGDVDGDHNLDLVVANAMSNNLSILLGKGDGTFQQQTTYAVGKDPVSVALRDFNKDGKLDLAVVVAGAPGSPGVLAIVLGNGDGTFRPPVNYTVGLSPSSVTVGDFNGDGNPDLAVANLRSGNVSILLGEGNGAFQAGGSYAPGGNFVAAADLNSDGKLDLVVCPGTDVTIVLLGNGKGGFQTVENYAVGPTPYSVAVGDFNGDGNQDLVVANHGYHTVSVLLGNGDGTFQPQVQYAGPSGQFPWAVAVGDFNGDGKLDFVVTNANTDPAFISVFLGNGDGTFQPPNTYPVGNGGLTYVVAADFNHDGKLDLAITSGSNGLWILLGNGDGTFQPAVNYAISIGTGQMGVGDFNGDGNPDLAIATGTNVAILMGNGDGSFQPAVNYALLDVAYSVAVGDFNNDGKLDLAVSTFSPSYTVTILLGNGDGTFQSPKSYPAVNTNPLAVADFNGDGNLDVVVASWSCAAILLGNGDGTFQQPVSFAAGDTPISLAVGDFNHDGKPDLAVANSGSHDLSILISKTP